MKKTGFFVTLLLAGCIFGAADASSIQKLQLDDYQFQFVPNSPASGTIEILRDGKLLFTEAHQFSSKPLSFSGSYTHDVTGDGVPDLVLENFSGGAHCCYTYEVFSLGNRFKKVAELEAGDSEMKFRDLDGDGVFEVTAFDPTFAYWETDFADSPAMPVILTLRNGQYVLDTRLMRQQISRSAFLSRVREMQSTLKRVTFHPSADNAGVPPKFWAFMLELIYSGNASLADEFAARAWPGDEASRQNFLREFHQQLAQSPYWDGLKELNHLQ